nr:3-phosphoshikimate 1-carboxyvinyltransferase [Lachnospiraceae bacterium]
AFTGSKGGKFLGACVDMGAFSDQALTLAALAPFAETPTTITGIGHIRLQECDRIAAIVRELQRLGVRCEELADGVRIYPSQNRIHGGVVNTYDDHRVAMSFALIGLRVPGVVIDNPLCCKKTFEDYFNVFGSVCQTLQSPEGR